MRIALRVVLLVVLIGPLAQGQAIRGGRFVSGVTIADYYRTEYVRAPDDGSQVWFVGEDIIVEWELFNGRAEEFRVSLPPAGVVGLLDVRTVTAPASGPRLTLEAVSYSTRSGDRIRRREAPTDSLGLTSGEAIYLKARLRGLSAPGLYELKIRPAFEGPYPVLETVKFELRAPHERSERAEIVLRRMARAFDRGDCTIARAESARLLAVHPNSSSAVHYEAECARREGRVADAVAAFAKARDLLDQQLDDLLIANQPNEARKRADLFAKTAAELSQARGQ